MGPKKRVVLLTKTDLRHEFFRKYIASQNDIIVVNSICESKKGNLDEIIKTESLDKDIRRTHLELRKVSEQDFFGLYCSSVEDRSNPIFIDKGEINQKHIVSMIIDLAPDLIISYGCSIIKSELLEIFEGRFVNIHLGLSPYYRGSGTNFWPIVNDELHFIGTTFMHIDKGIDTGKIIHQIRADIFLHDNIHQIGNRLILKSFVECVKLVRNFDRLDRDDEMHFADFQEKIYKKKDFTVESLMLAYDNLLSGCISSYLRDKESFDRKFPIYSNPLI